MKKEFRPVKSKIMVRWEKALQPCDRKARRKPLRRIMRRENGIEWAGNFSKC